MDAREVLYTTRAMRRVKPDSIPESVQARILDAAVRAPSGGNSQDWRFLLVDDPDLRRQLATIYADCLSRLWRGPYKEAIAAAEADPTSESGQQFFRTRASAQYLADHFAEVPLLLFAFVRNDTSGGSIYPAVWNAMLAARAEGVGSALDLGHGVPRRRRPRAPRRPPRQGMAHDMLHHVRVPTRPMGRRTPPPRARGVVPEPLGHTGGLRDPRATLALSP